MVDRSLIIMLVVAALILTLLLVVIVDGAETYTVRQNDSLWTISKQIYGKGHKWIRIHAANISKIKNPNHIRAGQKLVIPDLRIANADIIPEGYEYWKTVRAKVTSYCRCKKCCGHHSDNKTSEGDCARTEDGCATDHRAIPVRSLVKIPGVGYREVDDTGSAMRKSWGRGIYHIDIRFKTHTKALRWGTKNMNVKLYRKEKE